jgi:hypothetical protein
VANVEIRVLGGDTYRVEGTVEESEKKLSDAARSGQSRLAWFKELASGEPVGINPAHVVSLRTV